MKELSQSYSKALKLHNKILASAQLAQNSLWDMCSGLKEMRDGKLYKELGYQNFENYCGTEFNMSRRNAYYYISLVENMTEQKVKSISHFGATKLYLLSTLSESEQERLTEENDVESMTVRELKKEIRELKEKNAALELDLDELAEEHERTCEQATADSKTISGLRQNISALNQTIEELESRPIEVAVAEPSNEVRRLEETIKNLQRVTDEELDRVQEDHLAAERKLRQEHAAELEQQKEVYDRKVKELEQSLEDAVQNGETYDKEEAFFNVYLSSARGALYHLMASASRSANKFGCTTKIKSLLTEFQKLNNDLSTQEE